MISHLIQCLSADAAKVFFTFLIIVMLLMEPSIFSTLFSLCRATGLTIVGDLPAPGTNTNCATTNAKSISARFGFDGP